MHVVGFCSFLFGISAMNTFGPEAESGVDSRSRRTRLNHGEQRSRIESNFLHAISAEDDAAILVSSIEEVWLNPIVN
jgi:hypothetical protein